jgi:hypothetical protein
MQRMPAVSRPAWMLALSGFADRDGAPRRSPVEIIATMGSYVTRTQAAEVSGLRAGPFGRWADGALPVAEVSAHFTPPWAGKFAPDYFHPSHDGYRDWSRALLAALPLPAGSHEG